MKNLECFYLIKDNATPTSSPTGDIIKDVIERKVIGSILEISQNEFYQAQAIGFKPVIKVEIRLMEYQDEKTIRHKDETYKISKTYIKKDKIELTCYSDIK